MSLLTLCEFRINSLGMVRTFLNVVLRMMLSLSFLAAFLGSFINNIREDGFVILFWAFVDVKEGLWVLYIGDFVLDFD